MPYKYKIMYKSKHKYLLALLHLSVLALNLFFIFYLGMNYYNDIKINFLGYVFILIGGLLIAYTLIIMREAAILPKNKLLTKGPFKYARHPIYIGYVTIVFGLSLIFGSLQLFIYTIALTFALNYLAKKEEEELIKRFGKAYLDYKKKVKFII